MTSPGPERRHKIHAPRLKGYLLSWWRDDRFLPSALLPSRQIMKHGDPLHRPVNSGTYHEFTVEFPRCANASTSPATHGVTCLVFASELVKRFCVLTHPYVRLLGQPSGEMEPLARLAFSSSCLMTGFV